VALRINISERQQRVGAELRKLRQQAGLSVNEGSRLISMGGPHLSHIEAGRTGIPPQRLRELVKSYGCSNEEYVDALVALSESKGKGWWTEYRKTLPQRALDLAELESLACAIQSYETLLIPGLLQTEAYMRTLFLSSRPGASPAEIDTLVRFRLARQQVLADHSPTTLHAVIHEAALRITVGGANVMRGQLTHLLQAAQRPGTTIQILPFDAGARPWFGTPLFVLNSQVKGLETVILEHPAEPLRLGDAEAVARYKSTFDSLSRNALSPVTADSSPGSHAQRDSWGLLHHVLYTY
jgi:transcriptional regulator with XRE-family HTH domain